MIEQIYGPTLGQNPALSGGDEASKKRLKELHSRVVEHVSGARLIFLFMVKTTTAWMKISLLIPTLLKLFYRTFA